MISKKRLLEELHRGREEWEALLAEVGPRRMEIAGVGDRSSVKDIVAHVTAYERWVVALLDEAFGRPVPRDEEMEAAPDMDARNDIIYHRNRDRSLDDVLVEWHQVSRHLADYIRELPEDALHDPMIAGLNPEWFPQPWKLFAENTYEHYAAHMPQIRAWLARQGKARLKKT
jgi:hypothetical protein